MIYNYEIKKINGEEILYLYFDLDSEFAKFYFSKNINKLEDLIKNFIKENKISFTGLSVAIVVGGMLIYNVSLNNVINNQEILNNTPTITENIVISEEMVEQEKEDAIENQVVEEKTNNNIENVLIGSNEVNNQVQIDQVNHSNQNNNTLEDISQEEVKIEVKEEIKTETSQEEVEENKIYVTVYRNNGTIINLELEQYIIGVVGAEMPASFNLEALKSQAILARTYALKAIEKGIVLTDDSNTQNYKSDSELRRVWNGDFDKYYNKIKQAVYDTEGLYLAYNGNKIEAVYHSTSNGYTEDSFNVWGNSFPYLVSVESPYDTTNKSFEVEKFISYIDLSNKLNMAIDSSTDFNILGKTSGNRIDTIEINGIIYTGVKLRNLLGLRSTDFDIIKNDTGIIFKTRGYGHGVGMSQYGANGMANAGYTYNQILNHYYNGTTINHI